MRVTFGTEIRRARLEKHLSLKEVADKVLKEPGDISTSTRGPISPQYLNDLEHDRRNPPSDHLIGQLSKVLGLPRDYLIALAGQLPSDIRPGDHKPEQIEAAFKAFRQALRR
jgi:transcriptional regulator with XRE-family HTH domain